MNTFVLLIDMHDTTSEVMTIVERKIRIALVLLQLPFLMICSCAQSSVDLAGASNEPLVVKEQGRRENLRGDDLKLWTNIDTSATNLLVVKALRTFFDEKLQGLGAEEQSFWMPEDYHQFRRDYFEIQVAEYGPDKTVEFWPTLLSIEKVEGHQDFRFATVRWASIDSLGSTDEVKYVFQFLAKPDAAGIMRLSSPTEVLTEAWKREKVGDVTFVLSPKHKFSRKQADQQQQSIAEMIDFFDVESFPITFYSFQYATELLKTRGYILHPMFYKFETGGQVGVGDVVYSGNGRDEYIHEIVHLFITRRLPKSTGLLNEGLATLIGGSSGKPYLWHRKKLMTWLLENPDVDLTKYLNPYRSKYIEEDTSIPYVIGAVICDKLLKEQGKAVLFDALEEGGDPWSFLENFRITKKGLREVLLWENEPD